MWGLLSWNFCLLRVTDMTRNKGASKCQKTYEKGSTLRISNLRKQDRPHSTRKQIPNNTWNTWDQAAATAGWLALSELLCYHNIYSWNEIRYCKIKLSRRLRKHFPPTYCSYALKNFKHTNCRRLVEIVNHLFVRKIGCQRWICCFFCIFYHFSFQW